MSGARGVVRRVARRGHAPRGRRLGLVLACAGLVATTAACGARWDEAQREAVLARHSGEQVVAGPAAGGIRSGTPSVTTPTGDTAPGETADQPGVDAGGAPLGGGGGGGGESPGGAGEGVTAGGPKPCEAPSDAPGVTDSTITLGSISTLSGAVPGLGASSEGAARAYVAYRNATGGVCGRELVLQTADDGMDNGRHRSIVTQMNPQVLGIIGGLAGGDAGSASTVTELGMPVVSVAISKPFDDAPVTFNVNPYFADVNQPLPKYRWLHSQGVRRAAIAYTDVDQTRSEIALRHRPQMIAAGIEVAREIQIPLSTLSYDSYARQVANSGADYLLFLADGSISASMARAMHDTGYDGLRFAEYLTAYGSKFPELAGPGAEGAISPIRTLPNEEPGTSPEQGAFLDWFARVVPDQPADTFAADSWAAAKAFIDNLEALPGPITREALLAQLASVGEYDAGGFLGPIQLGPQVSNGCVIVMQYSSGSWRRIAPDQGFLC
jgi:ABC-type branched-subunit amino acid transport system substrate-binding protein